MKIMLSRTLTLDQFGHEFGHAENVKNGNRVRSRAPTRCPETIKQKPNKPETKKTQDFRLHSLRLCCICRMQRWQSKRGLPSSCTHGFWKADRVFFMMEPFGLKDVASPLLRMVLDELATGVLVLDASDRIVYADERAAMLLSKPERDLLGAPAPEHLPTELLTASSGHDATGVVKMAKDRGEDLLLRRLSAEGGGRVVLVQGAGSAPECDLLREECRSLRRRVDEVLGAPRLIPVCSRCGQIRLPGGEWVTPDRDASLLEASEGITHGYCPACAEELLGRLRSRRDRTPA